MSSYIAISQIQQKKAFCPGGETYNQHTHRCHVLCVCVVFSDVNTPRPFVEEFSSFEPAVEGAEYASAALPDHIYMDAMAFGMGCCCLQMTFQACNICEARHLYDQLTPLCPIMVCISHLYTFMSDAFTIANLATSTHNTHTTVLQLWILSRKTHVSRYQKKHSPTHMYCGHQSSLICFLIYYDPCHPFCSIYVLDSLFPQSLSTFSLAYLLAWHRPLHTPYISSPNLCLLFAAQAHTIAT